MEDYHVTVGIKKEGLRWVRFNAAAPLPPERRYVLLRLDCGLAFQSGAVAVGYLGRGSGGPYWVVPGVRGPWEVTHWCDCLGDDWHAPA